MTAVGSMFREHFSGSSCRVGSLLQSILFFYSLPIKLPTPAECKSTQRHLDFAKLPLAGLASAMAPTAHRDAPVQVWIKNGMVLRTG